MARARTTRKIGILFAAALVAAGCGGGGDVVAPDADVSPAPGADATQPTVGDTGLDGSVPQLDANGQPIALDPNAAGGGLGATAEIPNLAGGDIGGGLGAVDSTPIFSPGAVTAEQASQRGNGEAKAEDPKLDPAVSTPAAPTAPAYAGARFSVDGIVVVVDKNGAFPKDNPVFRLLSINASNVEVELIAGEFTTGGGSGVVLDKGELVSLVNASEQLTYRVKYLRPVASTDSISLN